MAVLQLVNMKFASKAFAPCACSNGNISACCKSQGPAIRLLHTQPECNSATPACVQSWRRHAASICIGMHSHDTLPRCDCITTASNQASIIDISLLTSRIVSYTLSA